MCATMAERTVLDFYIASYLQCLKSRLAAIFEITTLRIETLIFLTALHICKVLAYVTRIGLSYKHTFGPCAYFPSTLENTLYILKKSFFSFLISQITCPIVNLCPFWISLIHELLPFLDQPDTVVYCPWCQV